VVTRAITALEKDLGLRLLERTTRQLLLTSAGKVYHESACKLLQGMQQAADEARDLADTPAGVVRVTTSVTYGYTVVLPMLPALREAYPALEIDLLLSDEIVDLLAEGVDVALRLRQDSDTSLVGTRLARIRYHVCASPEYVNQHGRPRTPAELAAHDCVRCSLRGYRTQWKFRAAAGAVEAVNIGGWLVCSNSLALHRAALDGVGPTLLADWLVAADLAAGLRAQARAGVRRIHEATDTRIPVGYRLATTAVCAVCDRAFLHFSQWSHETNDAPIRGFAQYICDPTRSEPVHDSSRQSPFRSRRNPQVGQEPGPPSRGFRRRGCRAVIGQLQWGRSVCR
jgi:DNA-binding transcriptional LysR family regulator